MNSINSIADLRDALFLQLQELSDSSKTVDLARHRMRNEVAQTIVATAKVEVEFAAIVKGALDVPFIERQTEERPAARDSAPMSPMEKTAALLASGPSPDHVWRGRSGSRERTKT